MEIEIQATDFPVTQAIRAHMIRRLGFALSTRYHQIQRISVRISDINGPRGGNDKCCKIQVTLPGQSDVIIEDTEANLYVAIDRASERVGRTVARRLMRQREFKRTPSKYQMDAIDANDATQRLS